MRLRLLGPALLALAGLLIPSAASGALLNTTVGAAGNARRTCDARLTAPNARGVVQRRMTASATGLVTAKLAGQGRGDWDLAIFEARSRREIGGSSNFGSTEVAQGITRQGTSLVLQACRRSGRTSRVGLWADVEALAKPDGSKLQLVRIATPTRAAAEVLDTLGLDLTEHAGPGFREALIHAPSELAKLRKLRLAYRVTVPDVVAADRRAFRSAAALTPADAEPMPSGRVQYRTYEEFGDDMKALAEENPDLVRPITLHHTTLEGRPIQGIEITPDVNNLSDGKPVFLQLGVHHAREWPSAEMPMEWAIELVNRFKTGDERVTKLLGQARVIVVPVVNADGYVLSRNAQIDSQQPVVDPDFAYKRKNCRVLDGAIPKPGECGDGANRDLGVDPNRNYGTFWGGRGASTSTDDDAYRGGGPFSEPESQNIRELVSTRQVVTLITNHTYSDLVLRPPGLMSEGAPPDEDIYKALGDAMAAENGYTSQRSYQLYDTTGTTEDWSYYATGGLGFTFEIGKADESNTLVGVGFHPAYPLGVATEYYGKYPTGGGNREAYFKALESTVNPERHSVLDGTAPAGATIKISKDFETRTSPVIQDGGKPSLDPITFRDHLEQSLTVGPSGAFSWHVNPSTRPYVRKERRYQRIAAQPASEQKIDEPLGILPPGGGEGEPPIAAKDYPLEVKPEAHRAIIATMDGQDGDDYDMYLLDADGNEIGSSASATADETIVFDDPAPGKYTIRIYNYTATGGFTGAIRVYGGEPGSEQVWPAQTEAWTVTCTLPDGTKLEPQEVTVERGQRKAIAPCGGAAEAAKSAGGGAVRVGAGAGTLRFALAVTPRKLKRALRRGLKARARCSSPCTVAVALRRGGRVVARGTVRRSFAGRRTFTIRFTRKARRALHGKRRAKLSLVASARSAGQVATARRALSLKR